MLVAVLMMLAAPEQAPSDCAASAPRGPDFMAMMAGGAKSRIGGKLQDRIGGTIVDPPARSDADEIMPGTLASNVTGMVFPSDRPNADAAPDDAEQRARNEAAGICNVGRHPA